MGGPHPGTRPEVMTWEQLATLDRSGLIHFGSHTVTHPALSSLSGENVAEEVFASLDNLSRLSSFRRVFAYPYGDAAAIGELAPHVVRDAGCEGAFTVARGSVGGDGDRGRPGPRVCRGPERRRAWLVGRSLSLPVKPSWPSLASVISIRAPASGVRRATWSRCWPAWTGRGSSRSCSASAADPTPRWPNGTRAEFVDIGFSGEQPAAIQSPAPASNSAFPRVRAQPPVGLARRLVKALTPRVVKYALGFARESRRLAAVLRRHPVDVFHTNNTGCEEVPVAARLAGCRPWWARFTSAVGGRTRRARHKDAPPARTPEQRRPGPGHRRQPCGSARLGGENGPRPPARGHRAQWHRPRAVSPPAVRSVGPPGTGRAGRRIRLPGWHRPAGRGQGFQVPD